MFGLKKIISALIIVSSMILLLKVDGSIIIDIENDDVQRISEIIVQHYIEHQLTTTLSTTARMTTYSIIVRKVQALSMGILKMIAVMLTLVGANVITSKLDSPASTRTSQPNVHVTNDNNAINFCNNFEYGCKQNLCWRMCEEEIESNGIGERIRNITKTLASNTTDSWCFTTADHNARDFQQCDYSFNCSPCWPCLSSCYSQPQL